MRPALNHLPTLLLVLCAGGCAQSYNGAMGFGGAKDDAQLSPSKDVAAREPGEAHLLQDQRPVDVNRFAAVDFEGPAAAPGQPAPAQFASTARPRGVSGLGLFGAVDGLPIPRVSPLDGPDNLTRVTFTTEGADFDPEVDPTGKWLVYSSTRHRERADLYLKRVDGATVTQLTNDSSRDEMPTFSPDGKRIAFASDRSGSWDIYVMDARGGQAVQVTSDPTHEVHPTWSHDGTRLAYCVYGGPSGQWEIVVVDVDNPAAKRFIGHGLFPAWSPHEDKILFQRARQRGTRWFSIWTVDLVEGQALSPTEIAASSNAALITPAWSPDGEHIVFCTVIAPATDDEDRPQQADVWVVRADGTGRARLTSGQFANLQPVWASDGTIYFVSDRGAEGTENLWALRPDSALQIAQPTESATNRSATAPTP